MRVNEEIDRRAPRVDRTGEIPMPKPAPARELRVEAHEHRLGTAVAVALAFVAIIAGLTYLACCTSTGFAHAVEAPLDGSSAGANAVTAYELRWDAGEHSVTIEDLEREYELGKAYPPNGKDAALSTDSTYSKGAGMVDMITYDKRTNIEIRHYGQLDEAGRVRWYAAETVIGPDGLPVVAPRE